jgi:hypothetical protein
LGGWREGGSGGDKGGKNGGLHGERVDKTVLATRCDDMKHTQERERESSSSEMTNDQPRQIFEK